MGRPRKDEVKETTKKEEVKVEAVVEAVKEDKGSSITHEEAVAHKKAILDTANSDKQRHDLLVKRTSELENYMNFLNDRIAETTRDFEIKRKGLDSLAKSIEGANYELSNIHTSFNRQNEALLRDYNKKLAEVEQADKTLRDLIAKNVETERQLNIERGRVEQQDYNSKSQVFEMKKALDQNVSEWTKREADLAAREKALASEKEEFEAYKVSLKPEQDRITSIRNENLLLIQKIEEQRRELDAVRSQLSHERLQMNDDKVQSDAKIKQMHDAIGNERARLTEWEQQIKDFDLEVSARAAELNKELRRAKLEEIVKSK